MMPPALPLTDLPTSSGPAQAISLAGVFPDLERLPVVLRILLENALRRATPAEAQATVRGLREWLATGHSDTELVFWPDRVLMHDTTCGPALVDIAALRDAVAEAGRDPTCLNPVLPVDISVDHSIIVDLAGVPGALAQNMQTEFRLNRERFEIMKWATQSLDNLKVHPPGTGILHTLNLERLATVVTRDAPSGSAPALAHPDTLIGTDSHTPMINGLGVLAWGVGGLEAESVMFGQPLSLRIPEVLGVRLTGALPGGVLATDLALTLTGRLRELGVDGEFMEFFGPGVAALTAGDRAAIANMAPEFGVTTAYFPVDHQTLAYLRATGRPAAHLELVEAYARAQGLWADPQAAPQYSRVLELDLSQVALSMAGPFRPQDRVSPDRLAQTLPLETRPAGAPPTAAGVPGRAVAIAAITSCTNTSSPALLIAAGLVARKARALGLRPPPWVKTSLAPGSPTAERYLRRAGLLDDLAALGFDIVGYGCTTCIGNSGRLNAVMETALARGAAQPVAVLSGNRNFPGRVHPQLDAAFLASPPLVVACAVAGDLNRDLLRGPLAYTAQGALVRLTDLWPSSEEIELVLAAAVRAEDAAEAYAQAEANPEWQALEAPATPLYPWHPDSTYLRRPPFASGDAGALLGHYVAAPLLVLGDDVSTDQISPAGAISPSSEAAAHLLARGEDRSSLNVFPARRGNWEVMLRGLFTNRAVRNLLVPEARPGHTLHVPSGELLALWQAAERYAGEGTPLVLVAGERYGQGSSRDWAAKGLRLLGIRAVLARSFERIHRSNLIGMGILPLLLPDGLDPAALALRPGERIEVNARPEGLAPGAAVPVMVHRLDGTRQRFLTGAAVQTARELDLLRVGGVLPDMIRRVTGPATSPTPTRALSQGGTHDHA